MKTKSQELLISDLTIAELFLRLPGHIYIKDKAGVYLAANDRDELSCAADGTKEGSKLVGKTDLDFPWRDEAQTFRNNDKEVMQSGKTKVFIEHGKLKNGKMATVCSIKTPLFDKQGNIVGIIGNTIDITEIRSQLKQELSKTR